MESRKDFSKKQKENKKSKKFVEEDIVKAIVLQDDLEHQFRQDIEDPRSASGRLFSYCLFKEK